VRLAALVLAAGSSRRAGAVNKLLAHDRTGRCMIVRTVAAALQSQASSVIAVLGHDADPVGAALAGTLHAHPNRLHLVQAHDHDEGLAASLRCGVALAAAQQADGVLVCLGDMPLVRPETLDLLMDGLKCNAAILACLPVMNGVRGNPVLWRAPLFDALLALSGDRGGRSLLDRHAAHVQAIPVTDPGVLEDFDTPERLAAYLASG